MQQCASGFSFALSPRSCYDHPMNTKPFLYWSEEQREEAGAALLIAQNALTGYAELAAAAGIHSTSRSLGWRWTTLPRPFGIAACSSSKASNRQGAGVAVRHGAPQRQWLAFLFPGDGSQRTRPWGRRFTILPGCAIRPHREAGRRNRSDTRSAPLLPRANRLLFGRQQVHRWDREKWCEPLDVEQLPIEKKGAHILYVEPRIADEGTDWLRSLAVRGFFGNGGKRLTSINACARFGEDRARSSAIPCRASVIVGQQVVMEELPAATFARDTDVLYSDHRRGGYNRNPVSKGRRWPVTATCMYRPQVHDDLLAPPR